MRPNTSVIWSGRIAIAFVFENWRSLHRDRRQCRDDRRRGPGANILGSGTHPRWKQKIRSFFLLGVLNIRYLFSLLRLAPPPLHGPDRRLGYDSTVGRGVTVRFPVSIVGGGEIREQVPPTVPAPSAFSDSRQKRRSKSKTRERPKNASFRPFPVVDLARPTRYASRVINDSVAARNFFLDEANRSFRPFDDALRKIRIFGRRNSGRKANGPRGTPSHRHWSTSRAYTRSSGVRSVFSEVFRAPEPHRIRTCARARRRDNCKNINNNNNNSNNNNCNAVVIVIS